MQATASGVKVRHTSPKKLGEIKVVFPRSVARQAQVAKRLDDLAGFSKKLQSRYRQKLIAFTELKQSLLQKAFAGELTDSVEAKTKAAQ